jgi:hypothetical protein
MESYYVGLDVHSRQSAFVIQDAAGAALRRASLETGSVLPPVVRPEYVPHGAGWWSSGGERTCGGHPLCRQQVAT